jgi:hypothetical protein
MERSYGALTLLSAPEVPIRRESRVDCCRRAEGTPRSNRAALLVLALATASLAAVPYARAAQSHLEAHCDSESIVDETSESGGVSGFPWAEASAARASLALRAETNAASGGPDDRQCDILTTFSIPSRSTPAAPASPPAIPWFWRRR